MCQIITSPKFKLSRELLHSLYRFNSDGVGFAGGGQPVKLLPRKFHDLLDFYDQHIHERAGAVHFRMRTDGDISLQRVHPYEVIRGKLWVMHNGILGDYRSGPRDPESDTQKYIRQVLSPLLRRSPTLWKRLEFQLLVEKHIGSNNRFVFIDHEGETAILNRKTGYDVGQDWYANGYSFASSEFFPTVFGKPWTPPAAANKYGSYEFDYQEWAKDDAKRFPKQTKTVYPAVVKSPQLSVAKKDLQEDLQEDPLPAVSDPESLTLALGFAPSSAAGSMVAAQLANLRHLDGQEYHGIRQELLAAYKQTTSSGELERILEALVDSVVDTLMEYQLLNSKEYLQALRQDEANGYAEVDVGSVITQ